MDWNVERSTLLNIGIGRRCRDSPSVSPHPRLASVHLHIQHTCTALELGELFVRHRACKHMRLCVLLHSEQMQKANICRQRRSILYLHKRRSTIASIEWMSIHVHYFFRIVRYSLIPLLLATSSRFLKAFSDCFGSNTTKIHIHTYEYRIVWMLETNF